MNPIINIYRELDKLEREARRTMAALIVLSFALIVGAAVLLDFVRCNRAMGRDLVTANLTITSLRGELACSQADNIELRDTMRRCVTVTNVITRMDFGNIKGAK